jgi:hypothetical protein
MKTLTNLFLIGGLIVFSSFTANKNKTDASTVCLEVIGIAVDETNKPIDGAEIKLYKENEELEWIEITSVIYHEHSFVFNLEANQYYTIEISKNGFVSRSVAISTNLPAGVSYSPMFHYEFEVSLFKKKDANDYYLDFPVALISYNSKKDVFLNNDIYTNHIKTKIKESTNLFKSHSASK